MTNDELEALTGKAGKIRALLRARERVKQLERELRGEAPKPEQSTSVPEFLRTQVRPGSPSVADAATTALPEHHRAILK
jgi:hypothetical protein